MTSRQLLSSILIPALAAAVFCGAASAQSVNEQFDTATIPPTGWVMQNNSSPGPGTQTQWFDGNTTVIASQSGTGYIAANYNAGTGASTLSAWLVTPAVTLQNGGVLTFYTSTVGAPAFPDRLQVRMNLTNTTNVGTLATDVGAFTTLLLDINPTYLTTGAGSYPNAWTLYTINLSGITGTVTGRLAFRYFVENGGPSGTNSDYIGVDNVVYTPPGAGAPEISMARGGNVPDGGTDTVTGAVAGTGSVLTYTISNTGGAALTITTVAAPGALNNCTATITTQPAASVPATTGTTTLVITVTPTTAALFSCTVTFVNNDADENPYNWTISGTATALAPEIAMARGGNVPDGGTDTVTGAVAGTGSVLTYTISNTGGAALTITTVAAPGALNNCTATITTQPAASVPATTGTTTLVITVTPAAAGLFSCTVTFVNNDADENPYNWTISGTATALAPEIAMARGGNVPDGGTDTVTGAVAGTASVLTYIISNTGGAALTITTVAAPGTLSNCTATITTQPAASVPATTGTTTLVITVTPTTAALFSCTVTFVNNDADENPYNWTISGTATGPAPEVNVLRGVTAVLDGAASDPLGSVPFGLAQTVTYTVQNTGTAGLNLTGAPSLVVVTAVANVTTVTVTTAPAATVAAAGSTTFVVTYTVTAAAAFSFTVSFANNDSDENPYNWTADGTGTSAPEMGVLRGATAVTDGGTNAVGNLVIATGTALTYTINNTGNAALTITNPVTIAGLVNCTATVATAPAASVAAAGTTTLVITVTPTAAGAFSFTVSVVNNDADENPYNWTVSGTGTTTGGGTSGGGGGGGGCSTEGSNAGLLMLLALISAAAVVVRRRFGRA